MTEYLDCEIKDHDLSNGRYAKINIKPLQELPETIINGIQEQYHSSLSFSYWYKESDEIPEIYKVGNKIKLPFYVSKGYLNKSQYNDAEMMTKITESTNQELTADEYNFAESYMNKYEAIAKIKKPDFSLEKLDQCNYKDVVTSCKIQMAKKFG